MTADASRAVAAWPREAMPDWACIPSSVIGVGRPWTTLSAAPSALKPSRIASASTLGMNTNTTGLSVPAVRASSWTAFSVVDQPSRIQTGISPLVDAGSRVAEMEGDLPRHLRLAVLERRLRDLIADRRSDDAAAPIGLPDVVVPKARELVLEGLEPFGGDRRLQDVLTVDIEQDPLGGHLRDGVRDAAPDICAACDEVIDQQVREGVDRRANAGRERSRFLEPRDQECELGDPGLQRVRLRVRRSGSPCPGAGRRTAGDRRGSGRTSRQRR